MNTRKRAIWGTILGVIQSVSSSAWAGTCALCREALSSGGSPRLINGYYWSIILLVGVPLIFIGAAVRYAWRRYN